MQYTLVKGHIGQGKNKATKERQVGSHQHQVASFLIRIKDLYGLIIEPWVLINLY